MGILSNKLTLKGLFITLIFSQVPIFSPAQEACKDKLPSSRASTAEDLSEQAKQVVAKNNPLNKFTGKKIQADQDVDVLIDKNMFALNPEIINAGNAQTFSTLFTKAELEEKENAHIKAIVKKLNINESLSKKGEVSLTKMAYIIPKVAAKDFTLDLSLNEEYVEQTNLKLKVKKTDKKNILKTEKIIPVISNALTEMQVQMVTPGIKVAEDSKLQKEVMDKLYSLNAPLGNPGQSSVSNLEKTNYNFLSDTFSLTSYYDLPDKSGTLVITHTLAMLNSAELPFVVRTLMGTKAGEKKKVDEFKEESSHMIKQNRIYFSEKK